VAKVRSTRKFLIPLAVAASLLLAACGSSSNTSSATAPTPSAPSSQSSSSSPTSSVTLATASGPMGTYLVGSSGRAVYLWAVDTSGKSSCAGACAKVWQPVISSAMPHTTGGVNASDLTLITRSNGAKQVAYKGHPLYYYIADRSSGTTRGQGSNSFGGKWWLIAPSGTGITKVASSAGASNGSSSSSSSSSAGSSGSSSGGGWG
jgi:predicted lipoprotein with Yx(FWY)xxD motif